MWFVLFKVFRFGYSEAKKHKAKKQQQQQQYQQPHQPNPYLYNPHPDQTRGPVPGPESYHMDSLHSQPMPPATAMSKRTRAKDLAATALQIIQLSFGLAVIGLYGQDVNAARDKGDSAPSKWVYAVVASFLATSTALVYLVLSWWWKKRAKPGFSQRERLYLPLFVWEGILVILWLVVFGIFGEMYIGVYHVGGKEVGEGKVTRMRRAVLVDLVCLVAWVVSAGWRGWRWWKGKGRKNEGEGDGLGEKEMV